LSARGLYLYANGDRDFSNLHFLAYPDFHEYAYFYLHAYHDINLYRNLYFNLHANLHSDLRGNL